MSGVKVLQRSLVAGPVIPRVLAQAVETARELHDDHASLRLLLLNKAISATGIAIGSSSKKAVLSAAFDYLAAGVPKTKGSVETAFTATTHDVTANASAARERWYVLSIIADGTVTVTAGTQGAVGSGTIPATPSFSSGGVAAFGLVRIEVAAGATDFDATTDELDEGHLTVQYFDLAGSNNPTDVFAALSATKPERSLLT